MMSDEAFWRAIEEWRNSEEGKQLQRVIEIHDRAERIYQQAIAALYPVRIITTDNTRPIKARKGR